MKLSLSLVASYYMVSASIVWLVVGLLAFVRPPQIMNLWFVMFMIFTWLLPASCGIYVFFARRLFAEPGHETATEQNEQAGAAVV